MKSVKSIRPISITSAYNGYVATVGCKTFILGSAQELLRELRKYLKMGRKYEDYLNLGTIAPQPEETTQGFRGLNTIAPLLRDITANQA